MIAMEAMGKISNCKTSEYLRSGNVGAEDKNSNEQRETNKNENEETKVKAVRLKTLLDMVGEILILLRWTPRG